MESRRRSSSLPSNDGEENQEITLTVPALRSTNVIPEEPPASAQVTEVSEKEKRLRHFVVKEIVETEKSYLSTLDVVCKTMKQGMLDAKDEEPEFTEEVVNSLFSNVDDLREVHLRIVDDLSASVTADYDAGSELGKLYMNHTAALKEHYTVYGSTHDRAQSMIVELIRREPFKSYFTNILSDRGQMATDANIQSYLLCPVQRICKYPLLFRELCKYTWKHHPDYVSAKSAYEAMQVVCSVINEAKRRSEKLEAVHDWQQSVDGFEGSNLVDTCNEMVLKGSLLKISSGNCQERWFFLFDGVLVYCKKTSEKPRGNKRRNTIAASGSQQALGLAFKGRLALETMEVQNLEDGTSDQLTCGTKVTNAWRLQNVAKKKWFVCMASSEREKQQWMETLLAEREKRRMVAVNQLQEAYLLLSAKARNYFKVMQEKKILLDRKVKKAVHHQSFLGSDLVQIIMEGGDLSAINQANDLALDFMAHNLIEKVDKKPGETDKPETFEIKGLYTFKNKKASQHQHGEFKAVQLYSRIHLLFSPIVKDNKALLSSTKACFSGRDLIDFLIAHGDFLARGEAQQFGQHLFSMGFLQHVDDKHHFKDAELSYRFLFDNDKETAKKKQEFYCSESFTRRTVHLMGGPNVGIVLKPASNKIESVVEGSNAQESGLKGDMTILRINYLQADKLQTDELLTIISKPNLVSLTVTQRDSLALTLEPDNGFGFKLAGASPCTVSEVTPGSMGCKSGVFKGMAISDVGGQICNQAPHDTVATLIRNRSKEGMEVKVPDALEKDDELDADDLAFSKKTGGLQNSASVQSFVNISAVMDSVSSLRTPSDLSEDCGTHPVKITFQPPNLEYDTLYEYDTLGDAEVSVRETLLDAQFAYAVPAGLFQCLLHEDEEILTHVEMVSKNLADGQLTIPTSPQFDSSLSQFLEKMQSQCSIYAAMAKVLSAPRCREHKTVPESHKWELLAAPLNCNIYEMEVCTRAAVQTAGAVTTASSTEDSGTSEAELQQVGRVFYHMVTAGAPSAVEVCRMDLPDRGSTGLKTLMDATGNASSYRKWFHLGLKVIDELYEGQLQVRKAFECDSRVVCSSSTVNSPMPPRHKSTSASDEAELTPDLISAQLEASTSVPKSDPGSLTTGSLNIGSLNQGSLSASDYSDSFSISRADSLTSVMSNESSRGKVNQAAVVAIGSFLSKADKFCETLREKAVNAAVGVVYSPSQRESTSTLLSGKGARLPVSTAATGKRSLSTSPRARSPSISTPQPTTKSIGDPIPGFRERRNTIRSQRGGFLELAEAQTLATINKLQVGKKNAGRNLIQQITELKALNMKYPTEEAAMALIDDIVEGITKINGEVCRCLLHAMIIEEDLGVVQRRDIVFSQALGIVLSGFSKRLDAALNGVVNTASEWGISTQQSSVQWLNQLLACGLLVQFDIWAEVTSADEMAILEDSIVAVEDLRQLEIRIKRCSEDRDVETRQNGSIAVSGRRGHISVEIFLDSEAYSKLPANFADSPVIKVKACLFSSGMSDLEAVSDDTPAAVHGHALQCNVNTQSAEYLKDYSTAYRTFLLDTSRSELSRAEKMVEIDKSLNRLQAIDQALVCLQRSLQHNHDRNARFNSCSINLQANDIVNRCGGLRVCCSQKGVNRVSLSVSTESALLLMRAHQLPPRSFIPAVTVLRGQGAGMCNLHKNQQGTQYTLNHMPPSLYRPPRAYFKLSGTGQVAAETISKRPQKSRSFFAKASMRLVASRRQRFGLNGLSPHSKV